MPIRTQWFFTLIATVVCSGGLFGVDKRDTVSRLFDPEKISQNILEKLGNRVWENECGKKREGLVSWNLGEEFLSLGIGHFIWYPRGVNPIFEETFPSYIVFLKERGISIPSIAEGKAPWSSRAHFLEDRETVEILRDFLLKTKEQQVLFMLKRVYDAPFPVEVVKKIELLARTEKGFFALIDYVNFKGTGLSSKERYQGEGWGLLQVLERATLKEESPEQGFMVAAKEVLERRVQLSPKEREEDRWLNGWLSRVNRYAQDF